MKRQLSSKQTFFLRIILPILFIVNFAAAVTFSFYPQSVESGNSVLFLLPQVFIVFIAIILLFVKRFKFVSVDDKFLYASNYLKEVSIPLSNIRDVTESRLRGNPVTIHFKTPTKFGGKITFVPKMRFLFFNFSSHPVVAELKELAEIK